MCVVGAVVARLSFSWKSTNSGFLKDDSHSKKQDSIRGKAISLEHEWVPASLQEQEEYGVHEPICRTRAEGKIQKTAPAISCFWVTPWHMIMPWRLFVNYYL